MSWVAAEISENLAVLLCVQKPHLCALPLPLSAHPELLQPRRLLTIQHSEPCRAVLRSDESEHVSRFPKP